MIALANRYLEFNILVAFAFIFAKGVFTANRRFCFLKSGTELKINYGLLLFVVFLLVAQLGLPKKEFFHPPAKIWSSTAETDLKTAVSSRASGLLRFDFAPTRAFVNTDLINLVSWSLAFIVLLMGGYRLAKEMLVLTKIIKGSFLIRKIHSVKIFSSDLVGVPFSFFAWPFHIIVLPNSLLGSADDSRIAIFHELQHHRQRDTYWVHYLWFFRVLCFWNPAFYLWNSLILDVQEFACDEALVDGRKVSSQAYAGCLIRVAETAIGQGSGFVCATGLTFKADRHSLTRRINTMFNMKRIKGERLRVSILGAFLLISLGCIAMASENLIQDRRVDLNEANQMLSQVKPGSGFHVVVNDLVLKELNYYVGTPEGRDFVQQSLRLRENFRSIIDRKLAEYQVPTELDVIPIIESGYQNLHQPPHQLGAGLWMFIVKTARNYGLQVDHTIDERLSVKLETDAAMRYLTANHARFKSWELSVLAYNMGESNVQEGITKIGSRDVWALARSGYDGDDQYVARIMAAILIKNSPRVLE